MVKKATRRLMPPGPMGIQSRAQSMHLTAVVIDDHDAVTPDRSPVMNTQPAKIMASHLPMIKRSRNNPRRLQPKIKNKNAVPKIKSQSPTRNLKVIRPHPPRTTTRQRINAVDRVADHENQKVTGPAVRTNIKSQTRRKPVTRQLRNVAVVEVVPVAGDTVAVDSNQAVNQASVVAR